MTRRLVWTTPAGFILPEHHIDHGFSFSCLCSLFIRPPRALTRLITSPPFPSCWKASWCSALLNQQHIKVKSAAKGKRFPSKVPHHALLPPLKSDQLHSRLQKGGYRDYKIVNINISVVWFYLDHVCTEGDCEFVVVKEDSRSFHSTKSLNLWHFLSWIEPLQAEFNPELSLSELHPSNDYV